jgi:hypothetical protein
MSASARRPGRGATSLLTALSCALLLMQFGFPHYSQGQPAAAAGAFWVSAYYPGWQQNYLPADAIDYGGVTHIMHFSLIPNCNGTLNAAANGLSSANITSAVTAAHGAGKKILVVVGGAGTINCFRTAAASATRATFVANLVSFMNTNGYDGIDIDWEPIASGDASDYQALVTALRTSIGAGSCSPRRSPARPPPQAPLPRSATRSIRST